jgi:hypothetical protein
LLGFELRSTLTFFEGSVTTFVSGTGKGKGGVKSGACTESLELTDILQKHFNDTHKAVVYGYDTFPS